jgi:hydroxyacylglutathione hydrolase
MRPSVTVHAVPCFSDNYCWQVRNSAHRTVVLVDAAEAAKCLAALPADLELCGALTTHHHKDHSGGNAELAAARPGLPIAGGALEEGRVPGATLLLAHGQAVELGGMAFTALHTPCHTRGHVCYYLPPEADTPPCLFSGDTLFAGGCGRFFEGDAATMLASFATIMQLPPATRLYCGHEYVRGSPLPPPSSPLERALAHRPRPRPHPVLTRLPLAPSAQTLANLRFGAAVEPQNAALAARAAECAALAAGGLPTLPSTLEIEAATNVFLRTKEASVRAFTHPALSEQQRSALSEAEVLSALREAKNSFA